MGFLFFNRNTDKEIHLHSNKADPNPYKCHIIGNTLYPFLLASPCLLENIVPSQWVLNY